MDPILIAFIGYIIGALFRTLYDFLWKTLDNPDFKWDQKYTITMLISIILTFMSATVTFSTIQWPADQPAGILLTCVTMGFAINHLVNKPVDYLAKKKA
jgi:hypothetical protein